MSARAKARTDSPIKVDDEMTPVGNGNGVRQSVLEARLQQSRNPESRLLDDPHTRLYGSRVNC